jgi:probable phosphoglycerate mutase
MTARVNRAGRDFVARHGETVYNVAHRMQGSHPHTPLTRAGFAQASAMGAALRELLGPKPEVTLWSSSAGRALQTLAIVAEHLELDWHAARRDDRLVEIGMGEYSGRYYHDVLAEDADFIDLEAGLYRQPPPGGEWYDAVATRVSAWADDTEEDVGDRIVIMHGMSSRVLRGVLTGLNTLPGFDAPVAPNLPQGSIALIQRGVETTVHTGSGAADMKT